MGKFYLEICKCSRNGISFEITGRAKKAEVRGCGDIMATKFQEQEPIKIDNEVNDLIVKYAPGLEIYSDKKFTNHRVLDDIFSSLVKSQKILAKQNIDSIIHLISKARDKWMDDAFPLGDFKKRGLDFLINWTDPANLKDLANYSLKGKRGYIDSFRTMNESTRRMLKANPKGIIGHWLSGNVPILGLLTIVQGMITMPIF